MSTLLFFKIQSDGYVFDGRGEMKGLRVVVPVSGLVLCVCGVDVELDRDGVYTGATDKGSCTATD